MSKATYRDLIRVCKQFRVAVMLIPKMIKINVSIATANDQSDFMRPMIAHYPQVSLSWGVCNGVNRAKCIAVGHCKVEVQTSSIPSDPSSKFLNSVLGNDLILEVSLAGARNLEKNDKAAILRIIEASSPAEVFTTWIPGLTGKISIVETLNLDQNPHSPLSNFTLFSNVSPRLHTLALRSSCGIPMRLFDKLVHLRTLTISIRALSNLQENLQYLNFANLTNMNIDRGVDLNNFILIATQCPSLERFSTIVYNFSVDNGFCATCETALTGPNGSKLRECFGRIKILKIELKSIDMIDLMAWGDSLDRYCVSIDTDFFNDGEAIGSSDRNGETDDGEDVAILNLMNVCKPQFLQSPWYPGLLEKIYTVNTLHLSQNKYSPLNAFTCFHEAGPLLHDLHLVENDNANDCGDTGDDERTFPSLLGINNLVHLQTLSIYKGTVANINVTYIEFPNLTQLDIFDGVSFAGFRDILLKCPSLNSFEVIKIDGRGNDDFCLPCEEACVKGPNGASLRDSFRRLTQVNFCFNGIDVINLMAWSGNLDRCFPNLTRVEIKFDIELDEFRDVFCSLTVAEFVRIFSAMETRLGQLVEVRLNCSWFREVAFYKNGRYRYELADKLQAHFKKRRMKMHFSV
ncbi:hypothetical protein HDU76_001317 [Blyttiomyces sp. JEL0837]|nr:hypothetical protein HDU76_001317 [Blyttiomyces sp. JEL0837]